MTQDRDAVVQRELAWHNQESYKRAPLNDILYRAPAFDVVIQSGFTFLAPQDGEWILDFGGGEGKETLDLVKQGYTVVNTDLSTTQLQRARQLVQSSAQDACVYYIQADAEHMPFASSAFRNIYGKAILHHLDIDLAAEEINRILLDGGKATFAEPMAHHPIFAIARWLTPNLRTADEHPFTTNATSTFVAYFAEDHTTSHFLTAPAAYLFRFLPRGEILFQWAHQKLQKLDARLFSRFPILRQWAWYFVVSVKKGHG